MVCSPNTMFAANPLPTTAFSPIIKEVMVTIHCTITAQIADRPGYLDEFLQFWTSRPEVDKVWFSLFTPQRGATDPEILSGAQRASVIADLLQLRRKYPTPRHAESLIREIESPPQSPAECIFARTTKIFPPISKLRFLPASSAETRTANNAVVSPPWAWRLSVTIAWPAG